MKMKVVDFHGVGLHGEGGRLRLQMERRNVHGVRLGAEVGVAVEAEKDGVGWLMMEGDVGMRVETE